MYKLLKVYFYPRRNMSQIDNYFRNCSARLERKDICMETAKEKIDKYINGANVTRIMHIKNKNIYREKEKERGISITIQYNCQYIARYILLYINVSVA